MAISHANGRPLPVFIESATPHEIKLVVKTLENSLIDELPNYLVGDKAYDSDKLDSLLMDRFGINLIAPTVKTFQKSR